MKTTLSSLFALLLSLPVLQGQPSPTLWQTIENQKFTLHFTAPDAALAPPLAEVLSRGVGETEAFFGRSFPRKFDVWVFPQRALLDRQWQQDWGDTTFHSACWMVASGVGHRLDLLSPAAWRTEACEHAAADTLAVFRLLTHELVHVFHGQFCQKPDFAGMDALGWWVEGLAVFASGQLDSARLARVRELVRSGKAPERLEVFWSGANRYGLAGSVVAALDRRFGRAALLDLLPLTTPEAVFEKLKLGEPEVLAAWRAFFD